MAYLNNFTLILLNFEFHEDGNVLENRREKHTDISAWYKTPSPTESCGEIARLNGKKGDTVGARDSGVKIIRGRARPKTS